MPANVKCSVSNCTYWGEGNQCNADLIMVEVDRHANKRFDAEIGEIGFDSNHHDQVASSSSTCCHTFKLKK